VADVVNRQARRCQCDVPTRVQTADGVLYCETCEELLPDPRDELLARIVVKVDALERELAATPKDRPGQRYNAYGMNRTIEDSSGLLTVEQAARILGVSKWWIYTHQDELPIIRLGTSSKSPIRVARADLDAWLNEEAD
jgi:excisionase family DNA binding protein